jgi:Proteasome-substrate-size regulator, mid region
MFSKDSSTMNFAQGSLRYLAILEPNMIMPDLLERAYGGLEVVNETHRTTAVLNVLSAVARPLVSEKIWFGGQKHLLPLLELCIPGIDLVRLYFIYMFFLTHLYIQERSKQDYLCHDVRCCCSPVYQDRRLDRASFWVVIFK